MDKEFFLQDAEKVAKELLGKNIFVDGKIARIVETEAYYDDKDPASRACQNGDLKETMKMEGGTILVYGVHNNWLVNIVTGSCGDAQAVLIRAVEPLNFSLRSNGPGLLTKSLGIDKSFHKSFVGDKIIISNNKELGRFKIGKGDKNFGKFSIRKKDIDENRFSVGKDLEEDFEIEESFRIGVKKDLDKKLRFYINGNKWVSGK